MKRNKDDKGKETVIRSSAAEYLTFVASTGENDASYEMRYEDENIWLTQKMMAALYAVSKQTISQHIKRIYADGELTPEATVQEILDGSNRGQSTDQPQTGPLQPANDHCCRLQGKQPASGAVP